MKKSFIIFKDTLNVLDELTNEQAGVLFKAIKDFQNGKENIKLDFGMRMAFLPFKNQFLRDDIAYENISNTNKINGSRGGKQKLANATERERTPTVVADTDTNTDTDTDKENIFNEFRKKYPGTKRGNETEFENFKKKHADWKVALNELSAKLNEQVAWRIKAKQSESFIPEWANLQTWINQRRWESEMPKIESNAMKI